jgi:SAM-dependent methyltransferase
MSNPALTGLHRFRSAAPYYLLGRPAYSPLLIRHVVLLCGLDASHRIMDLGCGPGSLAVALAPYVGEVVAVDPEPAMLQIAAEHAARAGAAIRIVQGSSDDLGPAFGNFRIIVMGRAFHWMDRARTLERLDQMIGEGGVCVLFGDRYPELPENAWRRPYQELLNQYAVDNVVRERRNAPDWLPHEALLMASAFNNLERVAVIERLTTPVEVFVARAFSMSSTAPGPLGTKAEELAQRVRSLMQRYAVGESVTEVVETEALIARRSDAVQMVKPT